MKKGIIVLLIAVLVAGFAFAGTLTGSASISFGVNFDEKTFGFANSTAAKYNFKFEFDTTKVEVGGDHQTELWAEIAAEATAYIKVTDGGLTAGAPIQGSYEVKITKANIHVKDFTFGILNMGTGPDYAKSYYTYKKDGKDVNNDILKGPDKFVPGFTVAYKDYKGGFGLKGSWNDKKVSVSTAGWVETKAFTFGDADEFSAQAGAYALYYPGLVLGAPLKNAGVALKAGYKADKLTANAAVDLQIIRFAGKNNFAYEFAADVTYTINENGKVGANLYAIPGLMDLSGSAGLYDDSKKEPKLDAKVWANYTFDFDGTKLATEGSVDVRDVIVEGREITVYAKETLTVMEEKLALEFTETYVIFKKTLDLTAKATYTAEKFTAWASLGFGLSFAGETKVTSIAPELGIKSTKVIENAEIGLTWKKAEFAKAAENGTKKGVIEAYAKIAF